MLVAKKENLRAHFIKDEGQNYGFDGIENGSGVWGRDNFNLGTTHYYTPIKSIEAGKDNYVTFNQQGSGGFTFSLEINSTATPLTPEGNRIKLNVPVTGNAALYAKDAQNHIVGKLTILSYPMVTKNVVLVSLNGSALPEVSGLQNELNKIFAQGVASVNVTTANLQTSTYDGAIDAERDHYKYTHEMMAIVSAFKETSNYSSDNNTVYLFFGNTSTIDLAGVMNRSYQFGFIFQNDVKTIAHELGHGLFALEHTSNDNSNGLAASDLMDYTPTGKALFKYQWQYVQNPPSVWGVFESGDDAEYETDGHYSTVYLVCLMLGMNETRAAELAIATEKPDTNIDDEADYVMDQTWAYPSDQQDIHSLTGGFHGIEEFVTALKILYTPSSNINEIGKLLHRYGDSYAHTKLDNLKPDNLFDYNLANNPQLIQTAINNWKGAGSGSIAQKIEPWIALFNTYIKQHGLAFLTNDELQKKHLSGKTLNQVLREVYLISPSDQFKMYGSHFYTFDHGEVDRSFPDLIYMRPS